MTRRPRYSTVCASFVFALGALPAQDLGDLKIDRIAVNMRYTEGPAWSPEGFLLFGDTVTNQLHKFVAGKGISDFGDRPGGPMGLAEYGTGWNSDRLPPASRAAHFQPKPGGTRWDKSRRYAI